MIPVCNTLYYYESHPVKKEIVWLFANAISTANDKSILDYFLGQKAIELFLDVLETMNDDKMKILALESIEKCIQLRHDDEKNELNNYYVSIIKEKKGIK